MPVMTRRQFLRFFAATITVFYAQGVLRMQPKGEKVKAILRRRLPYWQLEEEDLDRFIQAHQRAIADNSYRLSRGASQEKIERELVSAFLLSTDFVAGSRQHLRMTEYADPYRRPCSNPFATFRDS